MQVYGNDVLSAGHYLAGHLIAKAYDALQDVFLLLDILLCCQLKGLPQFIYAEGVITLLHYLLGYHARPEQQRADGPEELPDEQYAIHHSATEVQGTDARIYLWHYLAKEQQKKGQQHRCDEEMHPV